MTALLMPFWVAPRHALLLSAAIEVTVNPWLVLLQLVLLTVALVALKSMLFEPLMALYDERDRRTEGARAEARKMDEQAAEMLRSYDRELEQVRRTAGEERDQVRAEAQRLEASMLGATREEVALHLSEGRAILAAEVREAETSLGLQTEAFAQQIATQLLGREVTR